MSTQDPQRRVRQMGRLLASRLHLVLDVLDMNNSEFVEAVDEIDPDVVPIAECMIRGYVAGDARMSDIAVIETAIAPYELWPVIVPHVEPQERDDETSQQDTEETP